MSAQHIRRDRLARIEHYYVDIFFGIGQTEGCSRSGIRPGKRWRSYKREFVDAERAHARVLAVDGHHKRLISKRYYRFMRAHVDMDYMKLYVTFESMYENSVMVEL